MENSNTENGNLFYEGEYNANGKRVYVALDSKALGDTLAWIPYIEEFGKLHNSQMIVSTFHNHMFENQYLFNGLSFSEAAYI